MTRIKLLAPIRRYTSAINEVIPPERIRNFGIIAHIDHGKSTLADRLLEYTGTINKNTVNKQVLDKLKVERDRGITIKAQTASMFYTFRNQKYLLNLIDTPGLLVRYFLIDPQDMSISVTKSLGLWLLVKVDACQGIQAQTVANFFLAFGEGLAIIPVINKIDLPAADPSKITRQLESTFEIDPLLNPPVLISAKTGLGIAEIFPKIIEKIPPPTTGSTDAPFRALLFDSWYDTYVGVICLIKVSEGSLRKGDKITSAHTGKAYEVTETGIMYPDPFPTGTLYPGQVGYVTLGMKTVKEAFIGDTFYSSSTPITKSQIFPGFKPPKPMVFSGLYPLDSNDYQKLFEAIERLTLNDSSVTVIKESSIALGQGFRLGFLGTLHMDVFRQRLEEEYNAQVITTIPTVPYKIRYTDGTEKQITNPSEFPEDDDMARISHFSEPSILGTLIFPQEYMGSMIELCESCRGEQVEHSYIDDSRVMMKYRFPLSEILTSFHDQMKSKTSGYATFEYEDAGYVESDICKLSFLLNSKPVDALVTIVHRSKLEKVARQGVTRLKDVIDRDLFDIVVQARSGGKIIARDGLKALRRDVTAKCYGGDITRKMKLLEKQKQGKKRMKQVGGVKLSQDAFLVLLKKDGT